MIIRDAQFITSVAHENNFLKSDRPIVAVAGKSNVGKSSFINMLANRKKLAKTSNTPGRTRLVNYFDFGPFILADLPGYGFARVSKEEQRRWGRLMERFFERTEIAHVFSLLDIRHDPTAEDLQMLSYLNYHVVPFTAVLTKGDKLSKMKLKEQKIKISAKAGLAAGNVIATAAADGTGKTEILQKTAEILALARAKQNESEETEEDAEAEKELTNRRET